MIMAQREQIGSVCQDGFACRHHCTTHCIRGKAQAASAANRTPLVSETKERRFNGMVELVWKVIHYRGFTIQPKLDMGKIPHLSNANSYRTGWVIVKDGCNAMPGASYATSPLEAKAMIDIWIEVDYDVDKFWKLSKMFVG
jgi:hypothetical protein